MSCGLCHECGHKLRSVLDGEEWCGYCETYRRYRSHGWARGTCEYSECGRTTFQWECPDCEEITNGGYPPEKCRCGQSHIIRNLTAEEAETVEQWEAAQ